MADKEGKDDSGQLRETAKPGSSISDDTSRVVTRSSDTVVDAESSSGSSGIEPGSSRSDIAERVITSSTDAEHEVSSAGLETTGLSPDAGAQSESSQDAVRSDSSSVPEAHSGSSPPEISEAVRESSEPSPDTGVPSECSLETQPGSSPTDSERRISSAGQEAGGLSSADGQPAPTTSRQHAPVQQAAPISGSRQDSYAEAVISSSTDVGRNMPRKKGLQLGVKNPMLAAMLVPDPNAAPLPPPPPIPRDFTLATEFSEADREEMRAFDPNRSRHNAPQQRRRPIPSVPRSISFEEATREAAVYQDEGDHVVPDVGVSWTRTPLGTGISYVHHEETTSDSPISEQQYTESESPDAMSGEEELTAEDLENAEELAEEESFSEAEEEAGEECEETSDSEMHAVVPTIEVPQVPDPAGIVQTVPAESVSAVGRPELFSPTRGRATKRHKPPPGESSPSSDDSDSHCPPKKMLEDPRDPSGGHV